MNSKWFEELLKLKFVPGYVQGLLDLYNSISTESVKQKVIEDIRKELLKYPQHIADIRKKIPDNECGGVTKNELKLVKWVELNLGDGNAT